MLFLLLVKMFLCNVSVTHAISSALKLQIATYEYLDRFEVARLGKSKHSQALIYSVYVRDNKKSMSLYYFMESDNDEYYKCT